MSKVYMGIIGTSLVMGALLVAAAIPNNRERGGEEAQEAVDIYGRWQVGYVDETLGVVNGTAFIHNEKNLAQKRQDAKKYGALLEVKRAPVEVTLVHPNTLKEHRLTAEEFSYDGKELEFTLKGDWPGAEAYEAGMGEDIETPKGVSEFTVRIGKKDADFSAKKTSEDAEENTVHLTFKVSKNALDGRWHYRADPQTGREKDGNGRVGHFTLEEDGSAKQSGIESWWRPEPQILLTVPIEDQMDEVYSHPGTSSGRNIRELMLFGIDLPIHGEEAIKITSRDEKVQYVSRGTSMDRTFPGSKMEKAFQRLEAQLPEEAYARLKKQFDEKKITALAMEAKILKRSIKPGLMHYAVNGEEGSWVLKFSDYLADLSFVRKISEKPEAYMEEESNEDGTPKALQHEPLTMTFEDGMEITLAPIKKETPKPQALYEPAWMAYYPEELYIQVATETELPYEKIPIIVAVDGKPTRFIKNTSTANQRKSIDEAPVKTKAVNTAGAGKDTFIDTVIAVKNPDNPRQYLTPPIALVGPEKPVEAAYSPDALFSEKPITGKSVLNAIVDHKHDLFEKETWHFETITPVARTKIHTRPNNKGLSKGTYILTWRKAVKEAAACYPNVKITDYERDVVKVVDSFDHYIVNAWTNAVRKQFSDKETNVDFHRKTNILLGDHASMLLLRDTFTDMIENHVNEMRKSLKNPYGLYRALRVFGRGGEGSGKKGPPILQMKVSAPDGSEITLRSIFGSEQDIASRFGVSGKQARKWQEKAVKQAVETYLPLVEDAHDKAWYAGDCDIQELIKIVGKGFNNVVGQTFPRLMRKSPHTGLWEPDRVARSWAMNLHILAESLELEEELSSQDTQMILFEGAMLFAIPAAINLAAGAGAWAIGVAAPELFVSTSMTAAAMAAMDVAEFGYASYVSYHSIEDFKEELDFANKSTAILGYERYTEAKNKEYEVYMDATVNMLFAAGGMLAGADDIVKTYRGVKSGTLLAEITEAGSNAVRAAKQGAAGASESFLAFKQHPKKWLGGTFNPWPNYSHELAVKQGRLLYKRIIAKYNHLWEKTARLVRGPPKTSPEILARITRELKDELRQQRWVFEEVGKDPGFLKKLVKQKRISKKQARSFAQRVREGERFFPDVDAIPADQLDLLVARIADDIFEEGGKYGLKQDVMIYRAKKRVKGALTTSSVYEGYVGKLVQPRVVSGAEHAALTPEQLQAVYKMYDEVMQLGQADKELLMMMLQRTLVIGEAAGSASLKPEVKAAYELARHIVERAAQKPEWAKALNIEEFGKVKDMHRRKGLHQMLKDNPAAVRAAINDTVGLDVLRGEPFWKAANLKKAVDRAKKRIKTAVEGVYESANPKNGHPKGFFIKTMGGGGKSNVNLQVMRGSEVVAKFSRGLETGQKFKKYFLSSNGEVKKMLDALPDNGKVLTLSSAWIDLADGVPNMLKKLKHQMIQGKGTPLATFLNMRTMHELGITFGDASLKICKMSMVLNKKTALQIEWLKRMYPKATIHELMKHTHSYKYAESALTQAGFKIKKVVLDSPLTDYKVGQKAWGTSASFGKEGEEAFLTRYGFHNPDEVYDSGHDIYLILEPAG